MAVSTSAGTTIAISAGLPATFDVAGFEALTFTTIGEVTEVPEFAGRDYTEVTHTALGTRATVIRKGSYRAPQMSLPVGFDSDDAGQVLARAAESSDAEYSVKVALPSGDVFYFQALVMKFSVTPGSVDSITTGTITLAPTAFGGNIFVADLAT